MSRAGVRVVYHVESHTAPNQVARLVDRLVQGSSDTLVVVSHDDRAAPLPRRLARAGSVVVRRDPGGYGDTSHVRRWLQTLRWLEADAEAYDWVTNLSGQCYPLRPLLAVESDLAAAARAGVDGFVESAVVGGPGSRWAPRVARDRYWYHHRRLGRSRSGRSRAARWVSAAAHVQPFVRTGTVSGPTLGIRRALPAQLRDGGLRGGSFFTTLGPKAVAAVLERVDSDPGLMQWFSGVLSPAEVFVQTVLAGAPDVSLVNGNRRYADFSRRLGNHPAVLDADGARRALDSGADFARKFDERRHPGLLDRLDETVRGPSSPTRTVVSVAQRDVAVTRR